MADLIFMVALMVLVVLGAEFVRSTCRRQLLKPIGLPQSEPAMPVAAAARAD